MDKIKKETQIDRDDGNIGGLYGWLLTCYGGSEESVISRMARELEKQFGNGIEFTDEPFHLERFLPYHNIMQRTKEYFGATDWKNVPSDTLNALYENNWKTKSLPNWRSIKEEKEVNNG